jgi:hypothetical protein
MTLLLDSGQPDALTYQVGFQPFGNAGVSVDRKSPKLSQGVVDGIAKMHERWNNRLVWNALDVAKEYACGRLEIVVAINSETMLDLDKAAPIGSGLKHNVFTAPSAIVRQIDKLNALDAGGLSDWQDDGMFLCVVQLAKPVKQFAVAGGVNCKFDEEVGGRLMGCFYSFASGFEINPIVPGRKFRVPVSSASIVPDKLPCGVIEGRAQIANSIAQNEGQASWQGGVEDDLKKQRAILVTVDMNSVTVELVKGFEDVLKISDVFIGPFDF